MKNADDPVLLRDQRRALHAYEAVESIPDERRVDYEIAVSDLGASVLRSGLAAALASLERQKGGRGGLVLEHLAAAGIPGLEGATNADIAQRVRKLDAGSYMLGTREVLQVATWLKRAVQATFGGDGDA